MVMPRIAISTRSDPFMSLTGWHQVCLNTGIEDLDLDIANPIRRAVLSRGRTLKPEATQHVRSIWAGSSSVDATVAMLHPGGFAVVPASALLKSEHHADAMSRWLPNLKVEDRDGVRIAISLMAENREGTRAHLDRISTLRHIAEEWDLDLALDLTGAIDPRWEAEAAILRMGERLTVVRLTPPTDDPRKSSYGRPKDQMVHRVISTLVDTNFAGILSLRTRLPWWNWSDPAGVSAEVVRLSNLMLSKFTSQPAPTPHPPRRVF
jgi:hypothetical protein